MQWDWVFRRRAKADGLQTQPGVKRGLGLSLFGHSRREARERCPGKFCMRLQGTSAVKARRSTDSQEG